MGGSKKRGDISGTLWIWGIDLGGGGGTLDNGKKITVHRFVKRLVYGFYEKIEEETGGVRRKKDKMLPLQKGLKRRYDTKKQKKKFTPHAL